MKKWHYVSAVALISLVWMGWRNDSPAEQAAAPDKAAVERTRKQVQMLDDLYKNAIVLITENYVDENSDLPAGSAFIALFDSMKKKGWHEVRLLDATGKPILEKNSPKDEFERNAIAQLKQGKNGYEQIIEREGKPYLRVATPIPVALKKCVLCHAHYADAKPNEPIGALSYTIKIE